MNTVKVAAHIVGWMEDYAEKAGVGGFVVGVSGGIDSAVSSTLAARTGLPLTCVEMPIHQRKEQVTRAREHIDCLMAQYPNVKRVEVDLSGVFDGMIAALPGNPSASTFEMPLVNTRARLRMATLYYFAALSNLLVVGTGNKVEDFGIGFFTKYGDGGVDLSPIADLNKSEVYAVGRELGVIESIMKAPPTDGLWEDDRTDEDQIGASYPELEWAMEFDGDEAGISSRQKQVLEIYRRLNRANQHKMVPIPVCIIPPEMR
ncbi:MAG: NAD(+) synthase [Rhodospirillales bacterium]|nr:NAD(+) synthase [Rhodospirillales bacterium]